MLDFEDLIFQAHCALDTLNSNFEDGGTLQHCEEDQLVMCLHDGSETTINLRPIIRLVDELRRLT